MSQFSIKEITQKGEWEGFLLQQPVPPFLQSWNNDQILQHIGHKTQKLGVYEDDTLVGVCLIEEVRAKRGSYLYAPYGPVLREWRKDPLEALVTYLRKLGSEQGFHFLRFAPFVRNTPEMKELFAQAGFRISPIHMLAETLWMLDIRPSEEDLMKGMRKTTRNLVRRAIKEQVTIDSDTSSEAVEKFIKLHKETEARHQFVAYDESLFREQVRAFADDNQVRVLTASHQNQVLAAAIIMYYGATASYHHGASVPSKIPAAYLLQWEAIREAKARGCTQYNFWGITESSDKKHPFYGLSLFKKGFGGEVLHLLPCQDLPLSPRYALTYGIESVRRVRRGFGLKRA